MRARRQAQRAGHIVGQIAGRIAARIGLGALVGLGAPACREAVRPAPPLVEPTPRAPSPLSPPSGPAAAAVGSARASRLQLELGLAEERTGRELHLAVPLLRLELRTVGPTAIEVPRPGMDLLLSLRVHLVGKKGEEVRRVRAFLAWPVSLEPLPPGEARVQLLSPLSQEQRDVPLPPGRYQARVCVVPHAKALYPSTFTERFGGSCSNPVEIGVSRR
jgi:hypothetical protein